MAASIASGVATGDFSSAWNMVNSLMLLAFIPMMPNNIALPVVALMKSFLDFEIIPNLFELILDEDEFVGPEPYSNAQEFGYDNSVWIINGGEMLSSVLVMFCFLPVALAMRKCKNSTIASYFAGVVISYKWSFFIRAWIEIYLELGIATVLQILGPSDSNVTLLTNSILGYIFAFSLSISPLVITAFLWISWSKMVKPTTAYSNLYGSLFMEFKNNGSVMGGMYYSLFYWRRLVYVLNIVFMRDYKLIQFLINMGLSGANLIFLFVYLPYTHIVTNIVALYSELGILAVFGLSYGFSYYDSEFM